MTDTKAGTAKRDALIAATSEATRDKYRKAAAATLAIPCRDDIQYRNSVRGLAATCWNIGLVREYNDLSRYVLR